ncbi:MAG: putative ABC transporter permease [Clostridiales bacterium]|nr:putative ABC transporter permease [Clostridiales bacterium]
MERIWKRKDEFTLQPKLYSFPELFAMAALVSLLGFLVENLWMLIRSGFIDNRNMNLPFLLGYGLAVVGMYLFIGTPKKGHFFLYYSLVFTMVSLGEILLGFTVEEFCGFYYWDYTNLPMHLTRYTSFFTSLGFSAIITLFMYYCYEPVMGYFHSKMTPRRRRIVIALFIVLIVDMLYSFNTMRELGDVYKSWKIYVSIPAK